MVGYRNDRFFFPYKSLDFECYATFADAHISSLGYLWFLLTINLCIRRKTDNFDAFKCDLKESMKTLCKTLSEFHQLLDISMVSSC